MNKVIITGHRQAGCKELEEILLGHGMSRPLPSLMQGLLPVEITAAMLDGNARQQRANASEPDYRALAPGPIWKELLIDLLIANTEQQWWGWVDLKFLPLLDYWSEMDPQTLFVLVYDEPHTVFEEARDSNEDTDFGTDAMLCEKLDDWAACNQMLLNFHLHNPQRAILVSSKQARQAENAFVNEVRLRLGLDEALSREMVDDECVLSNVPSKNSNPEKPDSLEAAWNSWLAASGKGAGAQVGLLFPASVERLAIVRYLTSKQPYLDLYQELQAASNTPAGSDCSLPVFDAWKSIKKQRECIVSILCSARDRCLELGVRNHGVMKENELLRNQLHQIRIELESQYLRNLEVVKNAEHKIAQREKDVVRLQGINKEIETLNLRNMKEIETLNLRNMENQRKSEGKIKKLNDILALHGIRIEKDSQDRIVWPPRGAVRKIKQQPAYRLGAVIVSRFKSPVGLLGIPMAIWRETRRLHQDRQLDVEIHMQSLRQYRDWTDASRIQDQLSYRLGSILVEKRRSPVGWISLPFALMREVRAFHKRRKPAVGGSAKTND